MLICFPKISKEIKMSNENTQKLAEKIANLLQQEEPQSDFQVLKSSIEKINDRLENIESQIFHNNNNRKSQIANPKSNHPSQQKYEAIEAIVEELFEQTEKTCTFEPNGKPCDACSMCSSHGF